MGWNKRRGNTAEIISMTGGLDNIFLWHQLQTVSDLYHRGFSELFGLLIPSTLLGCTTQHMVLRLTGLELEFIIVVMGPQVDQSLADLDSAWLLGLFEIMDPAGHGSRLWIWFIVTSVSNLWSKCRFNSCPNRFFTRWVITTQEGDISASYKDVYSFSQLTYISLA